MSLVKAFTLSLITFLGYHSLCCQEIGLVEILRAQDGLHNRNINLSNIRFDTIIDLANPAHPLYAYTNTTGNLTQLVLPHYQATYTYWPNNKQKVTTYIHKDRIVTTHFNKNGIQTLKEVLTTNSHIRYTQNYDTLFKTYLNPAKQPYLKSAEVNHTSVWATPIPIPFEIELANFGNAPFKLISNNHHIATELLEIDTHQLNITTKHTHFNKNITYTHLHRDTLVELDFITAYTLSPLGDTLQIEKTKKNFSTYSQIGATWIEKIYYPHHPILYKREVWIKQGLEQTRMYYNHDGTAIAKTYLFYNKAPKIRIKKRVVCGTPNMVTEELVPGYLNVYEYYNTQHKTIDALFLAHKQFSYQSYFFVYPAHTNGFYYKSNKLTMPSEPNDLLLTDKGEITVAELRKTFLFYLWNKQVKHYSFPTNHILTYSVTKGWNSNYHPKKKKLSKFEKAFLEFIQPYGKIRVIPASPRQLILIQEGQKQVATYPITDIWWEMQW